MPFFLRYQLDVLYVGIGAGPMTVPAQQVLSLFQANAPQGFVAVPGGEAPSQANFNSAITGAMTTDLEAQIATNLARIQAFAQGAG